MAEKKRFPTGAFCWVELGTTDAKSARDFYSRLLGWSVEEVEMPGGMGTYALFQLDGDDVAGMYELTEEQKSQGTPPNWLSYVSVTSADETAGRAKKLGATFMMDPMDVPGVGRMAILQDPTAAAVALFQPGEHGGAVPLDNRPGTFCWNELATSDPATARKFYEGLFGWRSEEQDMGPAGTYTMFWNGDRMAGGMMAIGPDWGPVPSHWAVYFAVEECDASVEKATKNGAEVRMPPTDIPDVGRFAALADPQGAAFSIIKLLNPQPT
ncbi:MAG: VOC family protein [Vicinamibacteria bacterium]